MSLLFTFGVSLSLRDTEGEEKRARVRSESPKVSLHENKRKAKDER
jgi:hypothetical protein